MASRSDKRLSHAASLVVIVLAAAACTGDDVVKVETVDLADGEFYGLAWGGTQVERFHVVARPGPRGETDPQGLVLVSPQHEEPCDLGKVQRYYTQQPRSGSKYVLGSPSPARLALFDDIDEHGIGTLSFADIDCKRTDLTVPDLESGTLLRLYPPDLEQLLLGVRDKDRTVSLVDPWKDRKTDVAQNVDNVWLTDTAAWFLEGGVLVQRDFAGRERRRVGTAVSQFLQLGTDGDFAYIDGGKLYVERAGKRTQLASDVCQNDGDLRSLDGFIPGAIAYYAPCDARRLVIQPAVGRPVGFEANVVTYSAQRGQLFIAYDNDDKSKTTIYSAFAQKPDDVKVWVELSHVSFGAVSPVRGGKWLLQVGNDDGTTSLLRLTDTYPSAEPQVVAENVDAVQQSSRTWLIFKAGLMTVRDQNAEGVLLQADQVSRWNYVFPGSSPALAYLRAVDEDTGLGRLELQFISGDAFELARDVREYREVWWPERGIVYARGGSRAGIKFARIEIPCQMTSDSPWACGF